MKSASVVQLLKVGQFLFKKQYMFKKITGIKNDIFKEEINSLLQVILAHMGIIRSKDKSIYIVNSDHYEYVTSKFWTYCKDQISEEEMVDIINVLRTDEVRIIEANGETETNSNSIDFKNVSMELKNLLDLKRNKLNKIIDSLSDFFRSEMNIIHIEIEEMDKKRYC